MQTNTDSEPLPLKVYQVFQGRARKMAYSALAHGEWIEWKTTLDPGQYQIQLEVSFRKLTFVQYGISMSIRNIRHQMMSCEDLSKFCY